MVYAGRLAGKFPDEAALLGQRARLASRTCSFHSRVCALTGGITNMKRRQPDSDSTEQQADPESHDVVDDAPNATAPSHPHDQPAAKVCREWENRIRNDAMKLLPAQDHPSLESGSSQLWYLHVCRNDEKQHPNGGASRARWACGRPRCKSAARGSIWAEHFAAQRRLPGPSTGPRSRSRAEMASRRTFQ